MDLSLRIWRWVIEFLASDRDVPISALGDIIDNFPYVLDDFPSYIREGLALRCLEELAGMACGETPPAVATNATSMLASTGKIDASQSCEKILLSKVAAANDHGMANTGFYGGDLQQFILLKREALRKPCIVMLMQKISEISQPNVSYSKEHNNFPEVSRPCDHGIEKLIPTMKYASSQTKEFNLIRKYKELKNLANTPFKSVGGASQNDFSLLQYLAELNALDDMQNQQTIVDGTCIEYQMERTETNPGEMSTEFHDVEMQSTKGNLSGLASPNIAPDNFKESQTGQESQNHLLHDRPKLQADSDCDDAHLLEQCPMPQPSFAQRMCIKCGSSDQLLNCRGEGCFIMIHERCLGPLASVEETGFFYCPLCSYRRNTRMLLETSKKKALEGLRYLFAFQDISSAAHAPQRKSPAKISMESEQINAKHNMTERTDFPSNYGDIQNVKTSHCRFTVENNQEITQNGQQLLNASDDKICTKVLPCKEAIDCCTYIEVPGTPINLNSESGSEHDSKRVTGDRQPVNDLGLTDNYHLSSDASHERNGDGCVKNSTCEVSRDHLQAERKNLLTSDADNELISSQLNKTSALNIEGGCDHSAKRKALSSEISARFVKRNRREKADRDDNYHSAIENKRTYGPSLKKKRKRPNRQNRCSAIKRPCRRPKLIWKPEEEEALEKAMEKIPQNDAGSTSWIKILEYCRPVLDESRTPIDLKDKWRNMQKRGAKNRAV